VGEIFFRVDQASLVVTRKFFAAWYQKFYR
jgi:hypothetical protein